MAFPSTDNSASDVNHNNDNSNSGESKELVREVEDEQLPIDTLGRLLKKVTRRRAALLSHSQFVKEECRLDQLPRFRFNDIQTGKLVAKGGFSNVFNIDSFNCKTSLLNDDETNGKEEGVRKQQYVLKSLKPELVRDEKRVIIGAKDLVLEAHFLSTCKHRNIIELRGCSASGVDGFADTGRADGFFLVYEKLYETLAQRISKWRTRAHGNNNNNSKSCRHHSGRTSLSNTSTTATTTTPTSTTDAKELFAERIQVAIDIASAIEYLHRHRIVYRDLKPANVGFDYDGVVKLFDFGLAAELPGDENDDPDKTYHLSGNTGTSRYMAVEVIRRQPYNCKADVFSFSVLLWEMMALCKPYNGFSGDDVKRCVDKNNVRPLIVKAWPTSLRYLLECCWSESIEERPHMKQVGERLQHIHNLLSSEIQAEKSNNSKVREGVRPERRSSFLGKLLGRRRSLQQ